MSSCDLTSLWRIPFAAANQWSSSVLAWASLQRSLSFVVANCFVTTSIFLRCGELEATVFLDLSFTVVKHSFAVANLFAVVKRQANYCKSVTSSSLDFFLTLLDFPSNPAKH